MRAAKIGSVLVLILGMTVLEGRAQQKDKDKSKEQGKNEAVAIEAKPTEPAPHRPQPDSITENSVTVAGQKIAYRAIAGTITVGNSEAYDALLGLDGQLLPDSGMNPPDAAKPEDAPSTARMFYTAYFKKDVPEA